MNEENQPPKPPRRVPSKQNDEKNLKVEEEVTEEPTEEEYPPKPVRPFLPSQPKTAQQKPILISEIPSPKPIVRDILKKEEVTRPEYLVDNFRTQTIREETEEEEVEEKKRKYVFWWGLLFFFLFNIVLIFLLEVSLHPRDSVAASIIAYALGVAGLIGYSVIVRSKKIAVLSVPLLLILLFGASFLFHYVGAPVYNPFAPISERTDFLLETAEAGLDLYGRNITLPGDITIEIIKEYSLLALLIDFVIAIPMFIFSLLALTWLMQIFRSEIKLKKIIALVFALLFLIIGLIITPIVHLAMGSLVNFGSASTQGIIHIVNGIQGIDDFDNITQEEINQILANFSLAAEYIQDGSKSIEMFSFVFGIITKITDDLLHFLYASLILLGGIEPFINGSYQIYQGFQDVTDALNYSISIPLCVEPYSDSTTEKYRIKRYQINDSLFEQGMAKVNDGIMHLGNSTDLIKDAYEEVKKIEFSNIYDMLDTLLGNNTDFVKTKIQEMEQYLYLFTNATDALEALIEQPLVNGEKSQYTTLSHFLYGSYNLIKAALNVGDYSSFNGTEVFFEQANSNFSVVYNEFGKEEIIRVINSDTPFLNSTLSFLYDMAALAVDISSFGIDVGTVYGDLTHVVESFGVGYENIDDYSSLQSEVLDIIHLTDNLNNTAYSIENRISIIQSNANNGTYEMFSKPSRKIANFLNGFNLTSNVINANNIAHSFYHLFNSMEHLKYTYANVTAGETQFNNTDFVAANNSFVAANNSFHSAVSEMELAIMYMNETEAGEMVQLEDARTALINIKNTLDSIIRNFNNVLSIAEEGPLANPDDLTGNITIITNALSSINSQLLNVTAQ